MLSGKDNWLVKFNNLQDVNQSGEFVVIDVWCVPYNSGAGFIKTSLTIGGAAVEDARDPLTVAFSKDPGKTRPKPDD